MPHPTRRPTCRLGGLALVAAALSACATPRLAPAPAANETPGPGVGAADLTAGVRVEARAQAWNGNPANLRTEVTPMLVTITNGSAVPLRIRYNEMQLAAADGRRFAAIPPFDLRGAVTQPVTTPAYPYTGFTVAPYLSPYYPGITPVAPVAGVGPWGADPLFYDTYYNTIRVKQLPTADMVQRALPEGVLAPGGSAGGFVYFQPVGDDTERTRFRMSLVNALTGAQYGFVDIPFVVREGA